MSQDFQVSEREWERERKGKKEDGRKTDGRQKDSRDEDGGGEEDERIINKACPHPSVSRHTGQRPVNTHDLQLHTPCPISTRLLNTSQSLAHTHTRVLKYCLFSCNTKVDDFFFWVASVFTEMKICPVWTAARGQMSFLFRTNLKAVSHLLLGKHNPVISFPRWNVLDDSRNVSDGIGAPNHKSFVCD